MFEIKGIGEATEKKLNELGIYDTLSLIEHLPVSYLDMSVISVPQESADGDYCLFEAIITQVSKPFKKGKIEIFKAVARCENCYVKLVWFNKNYLSKIIKISTEYRIYGKLKIEKKSMVFYNPSIEEKGEKTSLCGIQPIYWTRGIIAQKTYRNFVKQALSKLHVESIISNEVEYGLMPLGKAYEQIHFPSDISDGRARERIALEKITRRICAFRIAQNKQICAKTRKYLPNVDFDELYRHMPFVLNASQKDALDKIVKVFISDKKFNAVLCGDVGSGKTAVAVAAAYFVAKNGYRTAIMAPTEILAKQHYNFINPIFLKLGIKVCFLSGSTKIAERNKLRFGIKSGFYDVIIGTHSLLNVGDEIPSLGFVVADEQHRFGVAQRTGLITKGNAVDVLTLSATPIPRSMQLVAYGEVEYITIKPRHESTVKTSVVPTSKREGMWQYIANECLKGNQAYVIAPKIYDTDGSDSESVENLAEELGKLFPRERIGILHGKIKSELKQSILDRFYKNEISILVSTTVVEVGIDVPNASIIAIMDAERFGLATLHQLRGRVGRKGQQAYCFLYSSKPITESLRMLCTCSNGFELAEKDFELRGGGDIFGLEQSGSGTIRGLTANTLRKAKKIVDGMTVSHLEPMLEREIKSFSLSEVSLT